MTTENTRGRKDLSTRPNNAANEAVWTSPDPDTLEPIIQDLEDLVTTPSPTGYTQKVEALLMEKLREMGFEPWQQPKGTVLVTLNPEAEGPGILLSAHIDTLGLMVRSVKSNGRLRVTALGGFPFQYAEQENVTIWTREGRAIEGTFRMNEPAAHGRRDLGDAKRNDEIGRAHV